MKSALLTFKDLRKQPSLWEGEAVPRIEPVLKLQVMHPAELLPGPPPPPLPRSH